MAVRSVVTALVILIAVAAPLHSQEGSELVIVKNGTKEYHWPHTRFYHRDKCPGLGTDRSRVLLDVAGRKYWPCPVCRPPIRPRR